MSRSKKAPATLAEVPKAEPASAVEVNGAPPEPRYVDIPGEVQLVLVNTNLRRQLAVSNLEAANATAAKLAAEVADFLGFRVSEIAFEEAQGPEGPVIRARVK